MLFLFWFSVAFLVYTFVGYPALLWLIGRWRARPVRRDEIWPKVSLIIVAHDAGKIMRAKLENTLSLEYPRDKREVIVVSDGSSDNTADIVREFEDVRLIELPKRQGKHYAQMIGRNTSSGEILAFTDASVVIEAASLRRMVENFADPCVGVVSSEDVIEVKGAGEASYVSSEMKLRHFESAAGSLVSVSGSFFGARREVCKTWHPSHSSDFFVPLHAVAENYRVVTEPGCRARFGTTRTHGAEFARKVRTIVHGLDVFRLHLGLLNPFRFGFFSLELASHKLFRWLVPYALAGLLISDIFLAANRPVYLLLLLLQVCFYLAGALGLILGASKALRPLRLAAFFLIGAAAAVTAWVMFSRGERYVVWEPSRRA